uniref:Uncharacterized protein n=1 Tax=Cereibacter sphaeroides (strain ATCC 17025 / ATH 2.4.3) TaxID=349102 RepID=A4WSA7_CERS5
MNDMSGHAEDYRVKAAKAGKAIYLPGKSKEQMMQEASEAALRRAQPRSFNIDLTEDEWRAVDTAIPDAVELIQLSGRVFSFLADGIASGSIQPEDAGFKAILFLSGKAMLAAEGKECAALGMLETKLRREGAKHASAKLQGRG